MATPGLLQMQVDGSLWPGPAAGQLYKAVRVLLGGGSWDMKTTVQALCTAGIAVRAESQVRVRFFGLLQMIVEPINHGVLDPAPARDGHARRAAEW